MGMFSKLFGVRKEKCHNHPQKNAIGFCVSCERPFCADCLIEVLDYYCCGSEICKNSIKKKMEKARHSAIASCARDLAEHVINLIDGGLEGAFNSQEEDKKVFKVVGIYNETVFLSLHDIMNTISKYLFEEERDVFFGEIYVTIRNILTTKYLDEIDAKEFQAYFDGTFKERTREYYQFANLNSDSFSEDPLYMSFGKKIANILGKELDLEIDANIQTLYTIAFIPMPLVREYLETIKETKSNIAQ